MTRILFSLDIMYYNISNLICQVLFSNTLTPVMSTNFAISFWMQPIIFVTVMFISYINNQTTHNCNQSRNSKYRSKNYLSCCWCHLSDLLCFVGWIISHQIQFVNTKLMPYSIFYVELYFYMIQQYWH